MKNEDIAKFYKRLGENIREFRLRIPDLSQEKLARIIGMSRTSIVNIEQGRHHIQVHTLIDFADKLNISIIDLLQKSKSPQNVSVPEANIKLNPNEQVSVDNFISKVKK